MSSQLMFSERFCARHRIPATEFDRAVFRRCLYPHARLLAPLLRVFDHNYFAADMDLVNSAGLLRRSRDLNSDLEEFTHHPGNRGVLRRFLRLRVSSRKLRALVKEAFPRVRETRDPFGTDLPAAPDAGAPAIRAAR